MVGIRGGGWGKWKAEFGKEKHRTEMNGQQGEAGFGPKWAMTPMIIMFYNTITIVILHGNKK